MVIRPCFPKFLTLLETYFAFPWLERRSSYRDEKASKLETLRGLTQLRGRVSYLEFTFRQNAKIAERELAATLSWIRDVRTKHK